VFQPTRQARQTSPRPSSSKGKTDPAPLSARQLWALAAAIIRELTWGLPAVAHEVRCWRDRARTIPDPAIREDALKAITEQRGHIDGAALFSILPSVRNASLLRLLVAYEIIWDFLDNLNERTAHAGLANGLQLHLALIEALDLRRPISNFYMHISHYDDGHYLDDLVSTCRQYCTCLPSHSRMREELTREAVRSQVCAINHDPDLLSRNATLASWAIGERPNGHEASWFEITAAASTDLTIFALLALAVDRSCPDTFIHQISLAYFPWVSILTAMLDSYVDQDEDAANGNHSYITHYPTPALATQRICALVRRCLREIMSLPDAEKHIVIAACMFTLYLSKNSALAPATRQTTNQIIQAGGSLTRILHPILWLWRTAYGLRAA
jgi:tetraprenyl-beta-curcumene synthase